MTYFVHILDEKGNIEILDDDFASLYPNLDFAQMPKLSNEQYQAYLNASSAKWLDGELVLETIKIDPQALISAAKSAKLAEINDKAQGFVNDLAKLDSTPEFERETWSIQRDEARAWAADKTSDTPTLAVIAQMRGVPLDLLRQKAYEKALAYQMVAAMVAGQRQAYEDRLEQAETVEQINAIDPIYDLPQEAQ